MRKNYSRHRVDIPKIIFSQSTGIVKIGHFWMGTNEQHQGRTPGLPPRAHQTKKKENDHE